MSQDLIGGNQKWQQQKKGMGKNGLRRFITRPRARRDTRLTLIALTKVTGSNTHQDGENYQFNKMGDFSHERFEIKYFF